MSQKGSSKIKEDTMLDAIGDAAMQQTVRANYDSEMHDQELAVKKSAEVRKKRPVEETENSTKSEQNLKKEEQTRRRNAFEDGHIVVEEYNENGEIVRKTPPGYVLSNEIA
jgi:hypothetical protein